MRGDKKKIVTYFWTVKHDAQSYWLCFSFSINLLLMIYLCLSYAKITKHVNLKLTIPSIHSIAIFAKADNSCFYRWSYILKPTNDTKGVCYAQQEAF